MQAGWTAQQASCSLENAIDLIVGIVIIHAYNATAAGTQKIHFERPYLQSIPYHKIVILLCMGIFFNILPPRQNFVKIPSREQNL